MTNIKDLYRIIQSNVKSLTVIWNDFYNNRPKLVADGDDRILIRDSQDTLKYKYTTISNISAAASEVYYENILNTPTEFNPSAHASTHLSGSTDPIDHDQLLNFTQLEHFTQSAISIPASQISDFDTEVSNNVTVAANASASHAAVTVADTTSINLSLTGQALSGVVLPGGVDHNSLLNTHNLTTDINHTSILNTHNLTTDIDHNAILNNHNLTSDINHDLLTNFVANEHIDWTSTSENLVTTGSISTDSVNFFNAGSGEGQVSWNETDGTLDMTMNNSIVQQIGLETFIMIKNQSGETINDGEVVMFDGALGASGRAKGKKALATSTLLSHHIIGIATQDILNGEDGYITTYGNVRGVNMSSYTEGDILYVSSTVEGGLTNIAPEAPIPAIVMAAVIAPYNNGTILVRPSFPTRLSELIDVNGTPLITTGQCPVWDNTRQVFDFNYNITDYVTKVGTPVDNQVAIWTGNGTIEGTTGLTYTTTALTSGSNIVKATGTTKSLGTQDNPWQGVYAYGMVSQRGSISHPLGYDLELYGGQGYTGNKGGALHLQGGPGSDWGDVTMRYLPSDDTEDYIVAINDINGVLSKRSVTSLKDAVLVGIGGTTYTLTNGITMVTTPNTFYQIATITLPTALTTLGRTLTIKDTGGGASTYNVTIVTEGSQTIDGDSTFVIDVDYGAINLFCDGNDWFVY